MDVKIKNPLCIVQKGSAEVLPVYTGAYRKLNISLISFTVDSKSYSAEEGMTWNEWVNSEYNTGGYKVSTNTIVNSSGSSVVNSSNIAVYYTDKIVANATYNILHGGGA